MGEEFGRRVGPRPCVVERLSFACNQKLVEIRLAELGDTVQHFKQLLVCCPVSQEAFINPVHSITKALGFLTPFVEISAALFIAVAFLG